MNIVCVGAHPDDAEVFAGGSLLKWVRAGHQVLVVSMTNGDVGHHEMAGGALARRRKEESEAAAALGGYRTCTLDNHDGELIPSLEVRKQIVRLIRAEKADLVLTHRPWDYHPDHRYAAISVQDAAYMVMVPNFCPDVPALQSNPVFCYMMDRFTKPTPFQADMAVDVTDVMADKCRLLDAMPSQFYEWLPWIEGVADQVPAPGPERLPWLTAYWSGRLRQATIWGRDALAARYGTQHPRVEFAELFELCEYGAQPDPPQLEALFPR